MALSKVKVTVLDRHGHHVVTPLLPKVAGGLLEAAQAARPLRPALRGLPNVEARVARVTGIVPMAHRVDTDRGAVPYDYLVLAAGAVPGDAAEETAVEGALGAADLGQAVALRDRVLSLLEAAVWDDAPDGRAGGLVVAVVVEARNALLPTLPSHVGADAFGRLAALAWWTQDLPKQREQRTQRQEQRGVVATFRKRVTRIRHQVTGDRSETSDDYRT